MIVGTGSEADDDKRRLRGDEGRGLEDHSDGGTRQRDEGCGVDQWGIYFFASYPQCKNDGAVGDRAACMDVHGAEQ